MKKFTDTLEEFYYERTATGKQDDINMKEYIYYFNFLDDLPKDKFEEVARAIIGFFHSLFLAQNSYNSLIRGLTDHSSGAITSDLKTITKARTILNRLLPVEKLVYGNEVTTISGNPNLTRPEIMLGRFDNIEDRANAKVYTLDDFFNILDLVIGDLETKEFKLVSENHYYKKKLATKEDFRNYLINLCKEHKIKYTDSIRILFENL